MITDPHIYQFLNSGPEAFRIITNGMVLLGAYKFSAPDLKCMERRIDALFEPEGHDGLVYIIEFQAQPKIKAWYNLLAKVALYGEMHPRQQIQGILIFSSKSLDQGESNWVCQAASGIISAVYLDQFMPKLLATERDNPYVAVFAPLIFDNLDELKDQAPHLWRTVHSAPDPVRPTLEHILESWFFERFKTCTHKEVLAMFQNLCPLEETIAYQGIFAEGMAKGEAKGIAKGIAKGKAEFLKHLIIRRFKKLPKWADKLINEADTEQLEAWAEAIFDAQDIKQLLGSATS